MAGEPLPSFGAAAGPSSLPGALDESPRARARWAIAEGALVVAGALLVAWLGLKTEVFTIDSYYYLTKARSLGQGSWLTVPWGDGIDRKFFWGYSLALALPMKLFGESAFWLLSAALYSWTGLVLSRIFRMLPLSSPARFGAMALAVLNPVALWWSSVPMSEGLLVALASTSVYFGMRFRAGAAGREALWAALFGGLAFLTRVEGAFVALVLAALCMPRLVRERRWMLLLLCLLIFATPEAAHVAYLKAFAIESKGLIAYLDEARAHFKEFSFFDAVWRHLRAPFWMIFRFDTERWLFDRFFPQWLVMLQGIVTVLYLATLAAALVLGIFPRRGFAFPVALGLLAFAVLHSAWYYAYERYDYLTYPAAALMLAWGADTAVRWARPRLRIGVVLGLTLTCAAISGAYGTQVARMHAERLKLHQGNRDFRGIAKAVNNVNPEARPVITDLGPHLAFYLKGRVYFSRAEQDFYDDAVPAGEDGRIFLAQKRVAAIATTRPVRDVVKELALIEGEYHTAQAPGASIIVLDLPSALTSDG
ncbi:MAG: hypothetical protein HY901_15605 [Deltaproteobacteria bacterium]|nr:hypothetical protein [Deltaproteobacteria bacterium]